MVLLVLGACSTPPPANPVLKDPSQWPLVKLAGMTGDPKLPDEAGRPLAQIRVGRYDLHAWIDPSGVCGLAGSEWSERTDVDMSIDLTRSEGGPMRPDGFSGPVEPTVTASSSKAALFCTPTRMLIKVFGETSEPFVNGAAVGQVVDGGLDVVVGDEEALWESLPRATLTPGG